MSTRGILKFFTFQLTTILLLPCLYFAKNGDGAQFPLKMSSDMAHSICAQMKQYRASGIIVPPINRRPPWNSRILCGWYEWTCEDGGQCAYDFFAPCKISTPHRHHGTRIIGGRETVPFDYPSIVTMRRRGRTICAGTILSPNYVLTAAHCVEQTNPDIYELTAAIHSLTIPEGVEQIRKVSKLFKHKRFKAGGYLANDIGIFELKTPFLMTDKVVNATLAHTGYKPTGLARAVGWGWTQPGGKPSDVLQEVDLPIISDKDCQGYYRQYELVSSQICTLDTRGGKDGCQGDSGGPLYKIEDDDSQILIGITSWGIGCARPDKPGVWTEVSHHIDWIKSIVGDQVTIKEQ